MLKPFSILFALHFALLAFADRGYDPIRAFSEDARVQAALGSSAIGNPAAARILSGNTAGKLIEGYVVAQSTKERNGSTKSVLASVTFAPEKTTVALIKPVPLEAGRKAGQEKNPVVAFEKDKVVIERVGTSEADPAEAVLLNSLTGDTGVFEGYLAAKLIHRPAGNPAPSSSIIGLITITPTDTNVQIVKLAFTH
jgi:hypothetical protein